MDLESQKIKIAKIIALILAIFVLAGLGYFAWQITRPEKQTSMLTQSPTKKPTNNVANNTSPKACTSTLTSADQEMIALWKTFQNPAPKFSFKYPETWSIQTQESNQVVITDTEANIIFSFLSGSATEGGIEPGFSQESSETITVACQSASKTAYSADDQRLITIKFTQAGSPYLVSIKYKYLGASISSDIVEAFDLILKTIEFK